MRYSLKIYWRCKRFWPLILSIALSLLIVIILKYPTDYYNFYCIWINREGVNLYVSLITIIALMLAFYQWINEREHQKITDINSLFEELRHNIYILENVYVKYNKSEFYKFLNNELSKLGKKQIYPNPTDSKIAEEKFLELIEFLNPNLNMDYMTVRNNYIENAITSKNIFNLSNQRIFLNLGHLDYSAKRHNLNIENYNNLSPHTEEGFIRLRYEYVLWLHFRLHFMFLDLILNTNENYFIDTKYVNDIKKYIQSNN